MIPDSDGTLIHQLCFIFSLKRNEGAHAWEPMLYYDLPQCENAAFVVIENLVKLILQTGHGSLLLTLTNSTMWFCPQVTLIHSKVALADAEVLPRVRQEVKESLLKEGVHLLLSRCIAHLLHVTVS